MSRMPAEAEDLPRERGRRRHVAGIIGLLALALAATAWFWTTRQGAQTEVSLPHGVMVVGAGAFVAALVMQIRSMSLLEILELAWDLFCGLFSLLGALLRGIFSVLWELLGWD
jgi:uncharacterized protein (DUF58 family)